MQIENGINKAETISDKKGFSPPHPTRWKPPVALLESWRRKKAHKVTRPKAYSWPPANLLFIN